VKQFILGSRIDAVWGLKIWMAVWFATIHSGSGNLLVNISGLMLLIASRTVEGVTIL
jgi:hypothetical protein